MVLPAFGAWAAAFGKVYNGDDALVREAIYNANIAKIQAHNEQGLSWTMDANEFADLREEEFVAQYTGFNGPPVLEDTFLGEHEDVDTFEDSVDWVTRGAVNPIKNQGQCGSCWAFSTVGALEGALQISTAKLVNLAEQQLVDCDKSNDGCSGGWPYKAYDSYYAITSSGLCTTASYKYTGRGGSCRTSSCSTAFPRGTVTGHKSVAKSAGGLKSAVAQQPISVTVNAGQLQFYANGVVTGNCNGSCNHAVMAVGYGIDGLSYFKIRNSWGTGWGESGYIRLSQNGGSQGTACLLQNSPVYPVLSTTPVPTPPPTPPAPTPAPTPGEWTVFEDGFIPTGNDIEKSAMTIAAATAHCEILSGCNGFTINDSPEETGETMVWFKSAWSFQDASGWTAFRKPSSTGFAVHTGGFIPSTAADLEKSSMTVDAAKTHCKALAGCKGFTINDSPEQIGETTVWFKSDWDFQDASGWTSFEKVEDVVV